MYSFSFFLILYVMLCWIGTFTYFYIKKCNEPMVCMLYCFLSPILLPVSTYLWLKDKITGGE